MKRWMILKFMQSWPKVRVQLAQIWCEIGPKFALNCKHIICTYRMYCASTVHVFVCVRVCALDGLYEYYGKVIEDRHTRKQQ